MRSTNSRPSVFERVSPTARAYIEGEDFFTAEYSGSGNVTAAIQAVDVVMPPGAAASTSNSGCEATDFAGFVRGRIALVQRGTCDFVVKAENAENAGAAGVIIYNEGTPGAPDRNDTLNPTLGDAADVDSPVIGTSFAIGAELYDLTLQGPVSVHLQTTTRIRTNVPTQKPHRRLAHGSAQPDRDGRRPPRLRARGDGHRGQRHRF